MAIYHTHISSGSRDDGQSAAVKVAYILREGAYGGRGDLVKWGSGNMPAWAFTDPRRLFAAADLYERANGRLFVHVWVALPNELNAPQRHQLVLAIAAALTEAGLPYVYAIHAGDQKSEGEPANPHAHFVLSERVNDGIARDERQWFRRANRRNPAAGGAAKDRSLKELTWVEDTRKRVEELTNEHLDRAGYEERVTADSHAKRIAVADAEGDQETAEYLRLHPPGIHMGPAAAAMERNRYRGKQGEEPELARTGEPTERGNVARAKAAEKERTRGELERVSKDLHRAREEERCARGSVALARSVWLSDAEILGVYEESESIEAGTGWVAIAAAAELLAGRKDQAEAAAESFWIDVEAVVRGVHARGENAVTAVEQATGIFQEARLALMTNEVIVRIQAEAESSDSGSGWGAVAEVARPRLAWKARTEAAAREAGIGDIDEVYTAARSREEDPLPALEAATAEREHQARIVSEARAALLTDAAIARIREEAEASEPGSGWAAVEAATAVQAARKEQAEAGAVAAGVFEIEAVYAGAWKWREDPVAALEEATAIFAEARAALLPDVEVWRIHDAAESAEQGTSWAAVKAASASRQAQKEGAEAGATTFGLDIEGVYAGAQAGGADPVVALEEKVAEEERLASERRAAVEQREGSVTATKQGRAWLLAAQQEALGGSGGQLTLEQREKIVETVHQRLDEALRDSESALRSIPQALQYLPEVVGGAERLSTLAERESMVMTAEQRLGEELDDREERLVKSAGSDELLVEVFSELCALDASFGDGSSLPERWRIITRAEQWHEEDRAEDAERSVALDDLEAMLKETSSAQYLAAAQQEVLGEGKEPATLDERESVVSTAWRRVEQELDGREQALAARRCEDGSVEVGGAWLYAIKLTELEAGQQRNDGPSPGCREQALAWAGQQMDRLDALRQEEALDLFFEKLVELEPAHGPADIAEEEQRAAAARRQDRVDALSEDELVFVEEKRAALDPQGREVGPWKPAHIDAAVDYAHARVEALDEEIESLRTIIEETPGDGYARLLAAGFGEASRQQKLEALTVMETDLAEDFDRREERIRTDVEGEEFLRRGRLLVLDADREAATVAERGRVIDQADRLRQEAKREAEAKRQAEQERETRLWEEQRDADVQALKRLSGGLDRFHAHLADLDPKWDLKRNDKSSRENIDAALAAAGSDAGRLGRLRVVLSDKVDAARYREELGKVAGQFRTSDLDRALAAAEQERERRETRLWEEQRDAGLQALAGLPGGMDRFHAHLADLDPKWDSKRNNKSSRENIDAALAAAGSDAGRLGRFRVVLSDKVAAARYREELGKVAGQFRTSDLDSALAAAEQEREERLWEEQKAARVRREARHQMVSDTPGGDERLRAAGWEKARTDGMQDRVLATVELSLTADFNRREQQLRTDDEGKAFLRRGRVEVLEADREPETLAERGKVIERAEVLRQAAVAERKRVDRLKRLFAVSGGDKVIFASLDARTATWRARETVPADIDFALDMAEQRIDRTKPATAEHEVVVNAEQTFSDAPSAAWRQAGDRFPKGSAHARVSQQLADRALAGALAAEREEPPASPALVQRLFTWLRAQVDKLLQRLGLVKRSVPLKADELMNAFVARGEALDQVRMYFADLDPQTAVNDVVMKAIDPQLLKAALHPDEAARWTKPLNDRYEVIRRNHPERFKKEVEPVWEAQRCSWVAPLEADELMNAFVARGEALDQVRMHFADLDPQTAVPYVVMKAIDPQLLKAALLPGEAARWTKPLNDRYEVIRRNHPERFKKEVEPVWEAQRGFWTAAGSQDLGPTSVTTPAPVTDPAGDEEQAGTPGVPGQDGTATPAGDEEQAGTPGVPGQDGTATPAPVTDPAGDEEQAGTPGVPGQDGTATPAGDEEQAGTPGVPGQHGTATPARPRITVARGGERSDRTRHARSGIS